MATGSAAIPESGSTPRAAPTASSGYLPTLDGWRAVAILTVMLHHAAESISQDWSGPIGTAVWFFRKNGRYGVNIFFGISGFLICSRLLSELHKHGAINLKAFYVRRVFRILPPLMLFLTVAGALGALGVIPVPIGHWVSALAFFANYYQGVHSWYLTHFWSLSVEEHFYLFWPLTLGLLGVSRARNVGVALALAIGVWRIIDVAFDIFPDPASRTDTQLDGLLWGCVFAILYNDQAWRRRLFEMTSGRGFLTLVAVLGAAGAGLVVVNRIGLLPFAPGTFKALISPLIAFLVPAMLAATILHPQSIISTILEWSALQWIGRLSYSLYLWQQLFLAWQDYRAPKLGLLQTFPLSFVAAFACAVASYYLVEKRFVGYGAKLSRSLTQGKARIGLPALDQ